MVADGGWTWALPILFTAPWIAGAIWILLRSTGGDGEPPPSMAELARRRLWTP